MLRKKIFPAERRDEKGETEVVGFLSYMLVVPLLPYMIDASWQLKNKHCIQLGQG